VVLEEVATVMVLKQVEQVQAVKDLEAVTTALSFINMQRLVVVAPRPKGETL
jgi:maleate cis-trans isomerase